MFNKLVQLIKTKQKVFYFSLFIIKGMNFQMIKKLISSIGININCYNYEFNNILNSDPIIYENLLNICSDFEHKSSSLNEILKKKFDMYMKIQHYKGKRLIKGLPLNGQRTHTNSKTIKRLFNAKNKNI